MRRSSLVLVLAIAACGGGSGTPDATVVPPADADVVPVFRNPVAMADDELALAALQILGANVTGHDTRCNGCHSLTKQHIRYWATLSDTALASCFTDLGISTVDSAHQTIDCFRVKPTNPSANFDTPKLGVFAAGARLPWFQYLFRKAYGGTTEYDAFVARSGMPPSASPNAAMTQAQFDIVAEWFIRGIPALDQTLPEDPPPTECLPSIAPRVAVHTTQMATEGWRAHNLEASLNMYDCAGASDPTQCLADKSIASEKPYGTGWDIAGRGQSRVLWESAAGSGYSSDYWTRSSADGRFVGHGSGAPGNPSTVLDLQESSAIRISAAYDPAFFPDNQGFVFQGGARNVCAQSVLAAAGATVSMTEAGCSSLGAVGLYEHVGRAYGGDYFSIDGEFVSDNGGHTTSGTHRDPYATFGQNSVVGITPMVFNGTTFSTKPTTNVTIPYEGDSVISPTSTLMISRLSGPSDRQLGFVLRAIDATPNGTGYTIDAPEVGRYCITGGKPAFSYDERWIAYHHYLSPTSDADAQELGFANAAAPGYAPYASKGAANVYLLELATGTRYRLTNMKAGQYALYPHFRSDGWIYYQVRDPAADTEYTIATDGALVLE